jgi:hypothetical protein
MRIPWTRKTAPDDDRETRAREAASRAELAARTAEAQCDAETARVMEAVAAATRQELLSEDASWQSLGSRATSSGYELSKSELDSAREKSLNLWMSDQSVAQGVKLTGSGVFGRGLATPTASDPAVQSVIDRFWEDDDNQLAAFSYFAQRDLGRRALIEGELFFGIHHSSADPNLKLALIDPGEIDEIITHPDNSRKAVLYKRSWTPQVWDFGKGAYVSGEEKVEYYLDARYSGWKEVALDVESGTVRSTAPAPTVADEDTVPGLPEEFRRLDPQVRELVAAAVEAEQFNPRVFVYHVKTNSLGKRGIPELLRAYDWARSHARTLSSMTTMAQILAMFAWRKKVRTRTPSDLKSIAEQYRTPAPGPGAVQVENERVDTEPFSVGTGAVENLDSSARQTFLETIKGLGFGEHWYGDASTGNLATAKAMELPAIWNIEDWQQVVQEIVAALCMMAVYRSMAFQGAFQGARFDEWESIDVGADLTLDIDFPPAQPSTPESVAALVTCLVAAAQAGIILWREASYQVYVALGSNNVGNMLQEQYPRTYGPEAENEPPANEKPQTGEQPQVPEAGGIGAAA